MEYGNQKSLWCIRSLSSRQGIAFALKTRGPYQHRFDLPGGSQEVGGGADRNSQERSSGGDRLYSLASIQILGCMMCWFKKRAKISLYTISWPFMTWYSISNVLKNPFLMKFLMEAMIQQRQFG